MKPLKLVMSAFGSYGGREVVDFEHIHQGIFLITGDTGAGKTTIFDAITYALYDKTSGGSRDGNMMRSQYAADDTETYVEFTFLYRDEIYRVRRNPEYMRPGKRRNADGSPRMVRELSKVELIMPDGSVFMGKKRETDQKIAEIIGLDADQFRQVAMIAQGDFLKLLHAESRERKIIFSKIFHTKIYWRIQELLKAKAKELYIQLEDSRKLCQREIDSVECTEGSAYEAEWLDCIQNAEFSLEKVVGLLAEIAEEGRGKRDGIDKMRKELTAKKELLEELLRSEESVHSSKEKLDRNQAEQENLARWLAEQEELLVRLEREQSKAEEALHEQEPPLTANITRLEDSLKKYEQLEQKQTECKEQQKILSRIQQELGKAEKEIQRERKQQELLKTSLKASEDVQVQRLEAQNRLGQMEERQKAVKELQRQMRGLRESEAAKEQARAAYEKSQQEARAAADAYDNCYQQFFAEQAGILAGQLEEGIPCPVCGSCQHPCKAALSEHAPTQEEVEQTKRRREHAEKSREQAYLIFQRMKQTQETQREAAETSGIQLLGLKNFRTDERGTLRVEKELENVENQLIKAADKVEKIHQKILKREKQQAELENLHTEVKKQEELARNLEQEQQQAALAAGTLEREILLIKNELPCAGGKEARKELSRQQKTLEAYRKAAQSAVQKYQKQAKARSQRIGEQKALESQQVQLKKELEKARSGRDKQVRLYWKAMGKEEAAGEEPDDFSSDIFRTDLQELRRQSLSLEKTYMQIYTRNQKNEEALSRLEQYRQKQEDMRKNYTLYSDLSRTANGNLSGSIKMDFETYVQRQYFKQIISAANKRLVLMNNQQFILQCREMERLGTQGQVGLDLDVYHLVNDSARDVKTLSGGESFMAALAMALGLADIIQNEAGAIRLDTMFVDEGFGSLDDESRAQAIQVLLELASDSRVVGIISHVNELKEQIDRKLLVTKNDKGSAVNWTI